MRDLEPSAEQMAILKILSEFQHLHPHARLDQAVERAARELGIGLRTGPHAMQWLQLDPAMSVGRLRRSQISQLAQSMHRIGRRPSPAVGQHAAS